MQPTTDPSDIYLMLRDQNFRTLRQNQREYLGEGIRSTSISSKIPVISSCTSPLTFYSNGKSIFPFSENIASNPLPDLLFFCCMPLLYILLNTQMYTSTINSIDYMCASLQIATIDTSYRSQRI